MATVQIHGVVGEEVTLSSVLDALNRSRGAVTVSIHSPGGDVAEGVAIYNALRDCERPVSVKVLGIAASIASLIAMAGDTIEMPENTYMFLHNAWTLAVGDADDMREMADHLDTIDESIISTYRARTSLPRDEVISLMNSDSWLSATECQALGLCSTVKPAYEPSRRQALARNKAPDAVRAALVNARVPGAVLAMFEGAPAPVAEAGIDDAVIARVHQRAIAAGLRPDLADHIAVAYSDEARAASAIEAACDITAVCALVNLPADAAAAHIRAGRQPIEVREQIIEAMAAADMTTHTESSRRISAAAGPLSHSALWQAHQQAQKGAK